MYKKHLFSPRMRLIALLSTFALTACDQNIPIDYSGPTTQWQSVGGGHQGIQYSSASQIDKHNINQLEIAWEYEFPAYVGENTGSVLAQFQLQPILANNTLYGCSATSDIAAIDPGTGKQLWYFDAPEITDPVFAFPVKCRGVAYWENEDRSHHNDSRISDQSFCEKTIFFPTAEPALVAVNADSGAPCPEFGSNGKIVLSQNIAGNITSGYGPTSAPLVANDLVIVGSRINDNIDLNIASGVVRAFDVRTGALRWAWNPVHPDKPPKVQNQQGNWVYTSGTVNSWAPMSADIENGLLYVPTGNPSPDLYGGAIRDDYFGSSVVALDLSNGEVRWNFQTVHHDVWDYDVPSIPALFQHPEVGAGQLALAQPTKTGSIFLLDRLTGEPLYTVEERPVPQGGVAGEKLSKTQPFPTHPENIHPANPEAWGFTPWDKNECKKALEQYRWDGPFTPPSLQGSVQYPGASGGMNWGSASIDSNRGILLINQTHLAWVIQLIKREDMKNYNPDEYGLPNSLFPMTGAPYGAIRFPLISPLGSPCSQTPWGSITAVDLVSGKVLWTKALGSTRDLAPFPLWLDTGTPNFGGVLSTATGISFATGTLDYSVRGFDTETGELLWSKRVGGSVGAPPMTYRLQAEDLQYVVFAVKGSTKDNTADRLVAFSLKEK